MKIVRVNSDQKSKVECVFVLNRVNEGRVKQEIAFSEDEYKCLSDRIE